MISKDNLPILPGHANGRPATPVTDANELKGVGVSNTAFQIHVGDKITFDAGEPYVVKQAIRANDPSAPNAYYVACMRNGKESWAGIGLFTRRDADNKPIGEFQAQAVNEPNFLAVYDKYLAGKTITCDQLIEVKTPVFENGQRTEKTTTRMMPNIKYA